MIHPSLKTQPLSKEATPKEWFEWKNQLLTASMNEFIKQNPWFKFKKQDIFNNLKNKCNIPKIYSTTNSPNELKKSIAEIGNSFVLKKTKGHSSKEVLVLQRNQDYYYCFLTKEQYTIDSLIEWSNASECLIEESLSSFEESIPFDFKCYLIDGKVKYIGVFNRSFSTTQLCYFDAKNLTQIPFNYIFSSPPKMWLEGTGHYSNSLLERISLAINEAETIAKSHLQVQGLIVSLDMYVTKKGNNYQTWLGEITPRPGALHSNWLKIQFMKDFFEIQ